MGIIDWLETRASLEDPRTPLDGGVTLLDLFGGEPTYTGKRVNAYGALGFSAVWAATNVISGTVGALPLKLYRRLDRGKEEARDHRLWPLMHDAPNEEMTAINYREAKQGHLLLRGNTYSEIVRKNGGQVAELWPLDPDKITPDRSGGRRIYKYLRPDGVEIVLPATRVFHIAGLGGGNGLGYSVIALARQSVALGLSQEEYAARFFGNSSRPQGILSTAESLSPEARENIKNSWEKAYGGLANTHRVAVLDEDIKWQSIGLTNEDSQFLQSREFSVREIARWFNLPPHKIRDLSDATFSNIEAQNTEFVVDTLMPWLRRWEQAATLQLLTPAEREAGYFFEFVVDALLRGDSAARSTLYRELFDRGAITPNEIRSKENFDGPVDGGDATFIRLDMIPLAQAEDYKMQELEGQGDGEEAAPEPEGDLEDDAEDARAADREPETRAMRAPSRRLALRSTFLPLLEQAARRLVAREVNRLRRFIDRFLTSDDPLVFMRAVEDFYRQEWPADVKELMGPVLRAYAEAVFQAAAAEVPDAVGDADVGEAWVNSYVDTFANRYSADSRRQIQQVARDAGQADDMSPTEAVEARLARWDEGEDGVPRYEQVARREATQMLNAATKVAFVAVGVELLRWVAVGDNCPMCESLNGKVVGVQQVFVSAGETVGDEQNNITTSGSIGHPPLHDGCDCLIVPG